RARFVLWATLCLEMIAFGIILPVLPFHAERFGASPLDVSLLAASFSLTQFVAAPLLGRLADRVGRRPVILTSVIGATLAMAALGVADTLWILFAARLLAGSCSATMPVAHAYVADLVPPAERARSMAQLGAALGVGFVLGPVLGGVLS